MTGAHPLALAGPRSPPRGARVVTVAVALGLGLFAYHGATRWGGSTFQGDGALSRLLMHTQLVAFAMVGCLVVAHRASGGDPERRAPYLLAVVAGALLGSVARWFVDTAVFGIPPTLAHARRILYFNIEYMVLGGAAVLVWLDRRRAQAALARMHAAQMRRIDAGRRTLESQLAAMQARVEPQFLFDTLARVKRLYDTDAALGDRVLDQLIAYLRAAMPRMRDTSSTAGQEVDLVRAWLAIAREADAAPHVAIDIDPAARELRLPPMMLLPLVERCAARARTLRLGTRIEGERLRVRIEGDGEAPSRDDAAIAGLVERLAALYGDAARLALEARAGGFAATLDLPAATPGSDT